MNIRIQCLSLLIILLTLNPLSIANLIEFMGGRVTNVNIKIFFRNLLVIYMILIVLSYCLVPRIININMYENNLWILIGILCSPWVIGVEILTAYGIIKLKGESVEKIEIDSTWIRCDVEVGIYTVVIGVLEEIVYRQIWFFIMINMLHINIIVVMLLSSIFYSLNHITLGKAVLIQKFISGIIFSMLFYFSGFCILIPILCHGLQNLIVVIRGNLSE